MKRFWLAVSIFTITGCAGGCEKSPFGDDDDDSITPWEQCDAGDASFYRNASLAILGRRTFGEAELGGWMTIASNAEASLAGSGRRAVLSAMMDLPEFRTRWSEHFLDELRVPRVDDQDMRNCWGDRIRSSTATAALAQYVRDNEATGSGDGGGTFTMLDLMASSLEADDLSPVYRGHLFALVAFPIPAANVPPVEAELARREDFGTVFDAAYLNRDMVCLGCHNSEFSVTFDIDPALNRHWAMPGLFERSLYGVSSGIEPERAHAVFRFDGFAGAGTARPWGWSSLQCGAFATTFGNDPAGIDAKFGTITGNNVSVYDLEASLKRGVEALATSGLVREPDGTITDPDQAFAYLVAATIVEGVWEETQGSPLTIANYFPRNEASRDLLAQLTDSFVASRFSLRSLLLDIAETPYFNRTPPEQGCGAPYDMPAVYDPWSIGDGDPAKHGNSSADGVHAVSGKVLMRSGFAALGWPLAEGWTFPTTQAQAEFRRGIGIFQKTGDRGFRGLDFQARLSWEERYGSCANPTASPDFVDNLVTNAVAQNATVNDVVIALKDRLVNEAYVSPDETAALEDLLGASLSAQASTVPETRVRALCGVLLASPQFMLGGYSDTQHRAVPLLNP